MNIQDLSAEILDLIISEGKLDREIVDKLIVSHPTPALKSLVSVAHSILCPFKHNEECSFYDEESLEDSEVIKAWTYFTLKLGEALNIADLPEYRRAFMFVAGLIKRIEVEEKESQAFPKLFDLWFTTARKAWSLPSSLSFPAGLAMIEAPPEE